MSKPDKWFRLRMRILVAICLGLAAIACLAWHETQERVMALFLLRQELPNEPVFTALIEESTKPTALIEQAWQSGKIAHRQLAAVALREWSATNAVLDPSARRVLVQAARDVDASIREVAFSMLAGRHAPELEQFVQEQLHDVDPQLRLLALRHLRYAKREIAVPTAIRLLDDPEWEVVASAGVALRTWTGQDFGLRISQAIPHWDADGVEAIPPNKVAVLKQGVAEWKNWWSIHGGEFPAVALGSFTSCFRLKTADFKLADVDGTPTRLSSFRGKVVLLNFWTTWFPPCQEEVPVLNELQRLNPDRLVILGISLDGVPDEHGHVLGAGPSSAPGEVIALNSNAQALTASAAADRVRRAIEQRRIRYRVLLDPNNQVGSRFRGGELPTHVFIDPEGYIRRRFIGPRSVRVLQAMVADASSSPP